MIAFRYLENRMGACKRAFAAAHPKAGRATRPLARLDVRLALSLRLAGTNLRRPREKAQGRPKLSRGPLGGNAPNLTPNPL